MTASKPGADHSGRVMGFQPATKRRAYARVLLDGPSGSGKTWTGLATATALADGGRVAVIDSERGSASLYAPPFAFDVLEITGNFDPQKYVEAIRDAATAGYACVLIDSLTHAWAGVGGVLDIVDASKARFGGNSQRAWSVGTPRWQGLIDAMLQAPIHVVATLRSKTRWVEEDAGRGKKGFRRAGMEPVARDGIEYEFQLVGDLDDQHTLTLSKTRAGSAVDTMWRRPGPEFGAAVLAWLRDGEGDAPQATAAQDTPAEDGPVADAAAQDTPADSANAAGGRVISHAQRKRLFAAAKAQGLSVEHVRRVVHQVTGSESTQMPLEVYDAVITALEEATPAPADGDELVPEDVVPRWHGDPDDHDGQTVVV